MRNTVLCAFRNSVSRWLGARSGYMSSSSWVVMKVTSRSSFTWSWGKARRRASQVSHTAPTMDRTVYFRKSSFRSCRVMTFSQSHWST